MIFDVKYFHEIKRMVNLKPSGKENIINPILKASLY